MPDAYKLMYAWDCLLFSALIDEVVSDVTSAGRPKYLFFKYSVPSIAVTFAVPGYGDGLSGPRIESSVLVVYVAIGLFGSADV